MWPDFEVVNPFDFEVTSLEPVGFWGLTVLLNIRNKIIKQIEVSRKYNFYITFNEIKFMARMYLLFTYINRNCPNIVQIKYH